MGFSRKPTRGVCGGLAVRACAFPPPLSPLCTACVCVLLCCVRGVGEVGRRRALAGVQGFCSCVSPVDSCWLAPDTYEAISLFSQRPLYMKASLEPPPVFAVLCFFSCPPFFFQECCCVQGRKSMRNMPPLRPRSHKFHATGRTVTTKSQLEHSDP